MELLGRLLDSLRVVDSSIGFLELGAPYGFWMPPISKDWIYLFSPINQRAQVQVRGHAAVWLEPGDVALVLGEVWSFRSSPGTPELSFLDAWRERRLPELGPLTEREGPVPFSWGLTEPHGPCDRALAVGMLVEDSRHSPVLAALPTQIVLRRDLELVRPWITSIAQFAESAARKPRPGYNAAARHLVNFLFLELVRAFILESGMEGASWLRGITDPHIGKAMNLMHARPGQAWSRDRLAQACGLPGSTFSRRFRELVGRTPMDYLCSLRMHAAADQLTRGDPVSKVVEQAGYHSEWSFRRAFDQHFGMTPIQYAKSHRRR
jgi:AraC-like DNA-binding protein